MRRHRCANDSSSTADRNAPAIHLLDIRSAGVAEPLLALWQRSYRVEAELLRAVDFPPLRLSLPELMSRCSTFYGAMQHGTLLGAIEIETQQDSHVSIDALVVEPSFFRRGVGKLLVRHTLRRAKGTVSVTTSPGNLPALRLYQSLGFCIADTQFTECGLELCSLLRHSQSSATTDPTHPPFRENEGEPRSRLKKETHGRRTNPPRAEGRASTNH